MTNIEGTPAVNISETRNKSEQILKKYQSAKVNESATSSSDESASLQIGKQLSELQFESTFTDKLPGDTETKNFTRQVQGAVYSFISPTDPKVDCQTARIPPEYSTQLPEQKMLAWSESAASLLDLSSNQGSTDLALRVFSGQELLPGMKPYAQCYGGHQFGSWAGQLGDGRAINLGEIVNASGQRWELQLKGAGKTPYSRFADGRAVLRSSLREFLCSEAMAALGVPTTRALSLVLSGAGVIRDMFYSGDPKLEPGAIVCRMAPSFIRFGTFQLPVSRGDSDLLKKIADYSISMHYPELEKYSESIDDCENRYVMFLREVIRKNAEMVAAWQTIGFVHGVMNTDNMSILGLTIDYGPYGFLDEYDPKYTPNTTDMPGLRYCYSRQPTIVLWNLLQLAQALVPLTGVPAAEAALNEYQGIYDSIVTERWRRKLGFQTWKEKEDQGLLDELFVQMEADKVDFTNFFRNLGGVRMDEATADVAGKRALMWMKEKEVLEDAVFEDSTRKQKWQEWMQKYCARIQSESGQNDDERKISMNRENPKYIPRNYLAQQAIDKAELGDDSELQILMTVLSKPFDDQPEMERFAQKPPVW
eukprot:CAMPEP_0182446418 /NCGR_PEP_ID=MMETSP1172-20130603/4191_1 /TAXON_ID=708627 /ORGANISM="Timspurckia oligopyrenoides, Strain CCMP3278" /LENGTH=590 /DNA_ID=CAMNT_0024642347 /DNA_START=175 /DNA_END=1944 /DNA_ORIENTATION=-